MSQAPLTDDQLITQFRQTYSDPPENPLDEDDTIQHTWDRFDGTQPASGEGTPLPVNDNEVDLFWHAYDANDGVLSAFGGVGQDLYLGGRDVDLDGKDGDDDAYLWVKDYEPGVDQLNFPFDRGPEILFDGSFLSYETSEGKVDRVFKLKEGGYAPESVAGDIAFLNTLQDGSIIHPFIFDSQENISFTVPESLDDGKLDITNGENPLLEFSGRLEAPLNNALFTFISSKDSSDNTRDHFVFDANSSILDQDGNFAVTTDLSWNRSDSYQIGSISTNLGYWNLLSTPEQTATFMAATGIDPYDLSSFNLELLNNRADRTYPQVSLSATALDDGVLNVDAGEYGLGFKGFLEDRRDDGEPGSGSPRIDIYWAEAAGAHESVPAAVSPEAAQFLQVHITNYYNQPQWESTEWASGANAFGQVDLNEWDDNEFRWVMPGQWIVRSARLSDEALREYDGYSFNWLNDDSQSVYPRLEYRLSWNSKTSQFEPSTSSYQTYLDKAEFEQVYGVSWSGFSGQVPSLTSEAGYRP